MLSQKMLLVAIAMSLLFATLAGCQTHEFAQAGISKEQRDADSRNAFGRAGPLTKPSNSLGQPYVFERSGRRQRDQRL